MLFEIIWINEIRFDIAIFSTIVKGVWVKFRSDMMTEGRGFRVTWTLSKIVSFSTEFVVLFLLSLSINKNMPMHILSTPMRDIFIKYIFMIFFRFRYCIKLVIIIFKIQLQVLLSKFNMAISNSFFAHYLRTNLNTRWTLL